MHVIAPHRPRISLFADDGRKWQFESISHARKELGLAFIRNNVGRHFVVARRSHSWVLNADGLHVSVPTWDHERYAYVMRDDTGAVLVAGDFEPSRCRVSWWARRYRLLDRWNGQGPVPGVHRYRKSRSYRRMAHMSARRQAAACLIEEGEVPARVSRNENNLPDPWDDHYREEERCWKSHRSTQWKRDKPSCRSLWRDGFIE